MADTAQDIIQDAAYELNAFAPGETPPSADLNFGLRKINLILDEWAARKVYAYNVDFSLFALTPNHQPHLIGPGLSSPDFAVGQRPVRIEGATLVLTNNVDVPLTPRDDDWWRNQRVKAIATNVPTDFYYSAGWPNGALYLWPAPAYAYGLRLEAWTLLSQFAALATAFSLPPGYRRALTLTLAEELAEAFGKEPGALLVRNAKRARAAIQSNNGKSPRMTTADIGVGRRRGGFNYYSGQ